MPSSDPYAHAKVDTYTHACEYTHMYTRARIHTHKIKPYVKIWNLSGYFSHYFYPVPPRTELTCDWCFISKMHLFACLSHNSLALSVLLLSINTEIPSAREIYSWIYGIWACWLLSSGPESPNSWLNTKPALAKVPWDPFLSCVSLISSLPNFCTARLRICIYITMFVYHGSHLLQCKLPELGHFVSY